MSSIYEGVTFTHNDERKILDDLICAQICGKAYSSLLAGIKFPESHELNGSLQYDHERNEISDFQDSLFKARLFERLFSKLGLGEQAEKFHKRADRIKDTYTSELKNNTRNNPIEHIIDALVRKTDRDIDRYLDAEIGKSHGNTMTVLR